MDLPSAVLFCIRQLENAGYRAYAVGGCVRDHLLGITPHDYDITTSALPEQISAVFAQLPQVLGGEKHGTVGVILEHQMYEITTFRTEGGYSDSRHPDWVEFVTEVRQDLARRDFTVNAMAYHPEEGLVDPWGGRADLEKGILRAVGEPVRRFEEDALRILRAVRFAVRFDLEVEENTLQAMFDLTDRMQALARERVFSELCGLLPLLSARQMLQFAPILCAVVPGLQACVGFDQKNPHHIYDVYTHTAYAVEAAPRDLTLRWAALLHDIGKPACFTQDEKGIGHFYGHDEKSAELSLQVLEQLKAPTALKNRVCLLITQHMKPLLPDKKLLRRRIGKLGEETVWQLWALQRADTLATGTHTLEESDAVAELLNQLKEENACCSLSELAVNGRDLMELGFAPGKALGGCLEWLLLQVQSELLPNEKAALLCAAQQYKKEN